MVLGNRAAANSTDRRDQVTEHKHSPLPWKQNADDGKWVQDSGKHNHYVAHCTRQPHVNEKLNAAFIVKACNSHYELVEALEGLVADVLDYEKVNNLKPNPGKKYCWQSVERAREALRKAGVE